MHVERSFTGLCVTAKHFLVFGKQFGDLVVSDIQSAMHM